MKPRKNSSGYWETYVYIGRDENGKQIKKHIRGKTLREVNDKAQTISETHTVENTPIKNKTCGQIADEYIENRKSRLSPKTLMEYTRFRKNYFKEIHEVKFGNLTDKMVQSCIDKLSIDHSPHSVQNWWGFWHAALYWADRSYMPNIEMPQKKRVRFEMPDEQTLIAMLKRMDGEKMEIPLLLAITCGLRRGEISALDLKNDVDYDKGIIHVHCDMVESSSGYVVKDMPKTEAGNRLIPCPAPVLEKLKQARDNPKYKMCTPNRISHNYQRLKKTHGLTCSFHGLRHYYASVMASLDVPNLYQRERMGHTTDYMLNRYQEYLKEKEVEVNDAMMDKFNQILGQS